MPINARKKSTSTRWIVIKVERTSAALVRIIWVRELFFFAGFAVNFKIEKWNRSDGETMSAFTTLWEWISFLKHFIENFLIRPKNRCMIIRKSDEWMAIVCSIVVIGLWRNRWTILEIANYETMNAREFQRRWMKRSNGKFFLMCDSNCAIHWTY